MARKPNSLQTVQIRISTTPLVQAYLDKLVDTGLYGKNPAEAAERLIASGMKELLREGTLLRSSDSNAKDNNNGGLQNGEDTD